MFWLRLQGVNLLERLIIVSVMVVESLFVASFFEPVNCASTFNLKSANPEKPKWHNYTTPLQFVTSRHFENPSRAHRHKPLNSTKNHPKLEPQPTIPNLIHLQRIKLKTKVVKIKHNRTNTIKLPKVNPSNNSHATKPNNPGTPRLNFHASPLLSVGVEPTSSFQNGNNANMENLLKYGYPHVSLGLFHPSGKYQDFLKDKHQNNFGMNSFNIVDLNRETEYNAAGLRQSTKIGGNGTGPDSENVRIGIGKYKLTSKIEHDESATNPRKLKASAKSKSDTVHYKSKGLSGVNYLKYGNKSTIIKPDPLLETRPKQTLSRVRYYYAEPPETPISSVARKPNQPQIRAENQREIEINPSTRNQNQNSGSPHNTSGHGHDLSPSDIAGLIIMQLHSDGGKSSSHLQLSQPEVGKQQSETHTEPSHQNLKQKFYPIPKDLSHSPNNFESQATNIHNIPFHQESQSHHALGAFWNHNPDSYRSHTHHSPTSSKEEMEFQEGQITLSKVILGSKSLKKGTGIVILATVLVTLIIAGVTATTGASLSPILFPLILLPIAILAFALFIPSILLFVPIVIAGLAGGQERKGRKRRVGEIWDGSDSGVEGRKMEESLEKLFEKIPSHAKYGGLAGFYT